MRETGRADFMALLSERQQLARSIAHELSRLGAEVTTALPIADDQELRFVVLDQHRPQILERLSHLGWSPVPLGAGLRFDIASYSAKPMTTYRLDLPRPKTPIPTERGGQEIPKEVREFHKALLK
jgi:hypothetical protein